MNDSGTYSETDGTERVDDLVLWYAQALWSVRWFCAMALLAGLCVAAWAATREAGKRTVGLVRGVNPAVGYMHRTYWDGISRTMQAQLRMAGESFRRRAEVAVKADTDPWLVRIEIRHSEVGEGRQILDQMLQNLSGVYGSRTADSAETAVREEAVARELQLIQTLQELEQQLTQLCPDWEAEIEKSRSGLESEALPNRVFFNEGMLRLPFEDVPHSLHFRRLARAATEISRRSSNTGKPSPELSEWPRLIRLQQQATRLFLLHWATHDVFSAAAESHQVVLDQVFEFDEGSARAWLKYLFAGSVSSLGIAFLLAVPWHWLRTNWQRITGGQV